MRVLFAGLLVAHGLIHVSFLTPAPATDGGPPWPFKLDRSWLLSRAGLSTGPMVTAGRVLVIALIVAFALGGIGLLIGASWWVPATVAGAVLSLIQLTVWFHWWLPLGVLIDLVLIVGLAMDRWPALRDLAM
jgi:hypothetical protein